jgi:hypothetical protein
MVDVDTFLTALYVTWSTTSASRVHQKGGPALRRPFPTARCDRPGHLCPVGPLLQRAGLLPLRSKSPARDAFPTLPGEASSQFNRLVRFYVGPIEEVALHLAHVLDTRGAAAYTRLWTPRPCPFGTRSGGAKDGWRASPTSGGPTAWAGTKAFACSSPSTLPGVISPASASPPLPPRTSRWPKPSSPCEPDPTPGSRERGTGGLGAVRGRQGLRG